MLRQPELTPEASAGELGELGEGRKGEKEKRRRENLPRQIANMDFKSMPPRCPNLPQTHRRPNSPPKPAPENWEKGREEKRRKGEKEKRRICPDISPTWISNPCHLDARIYLKPIDARIYPKTQLRASKIAST
jgi:hypothetical protein